MKKFDTHMIDIRGSLFPDRWLCFYYLHWPKTQYCSIGIPSDSPVSNPKQCSMEKLLIDPMPVLQKFLTYLLNLVRTQFIASRGESLLQIIWIWLACYLFAFLHSNYCQHKQYTNFCKHFLVETTSKLKLTNDTLPTSNRGFFLIVATRFGLHINLLINGSFLPAISKNR